MIFRSLLSVISFVIVCLFCYLLPLAVLGGVFLLGGPLLIMFFVFLNIVCFFFVSFHFLSVVNCVLCSDSIYVKVVSASLHTFIGTILVSSCIVFVPFFLKEIIHCMPPARLGLVLFVI